MASVDCPRAHGALGSPRVSHGALPPPSVVCVGCGQRLDLSKDHCAACGKSVVREPADSDPTWPEPVENPAILGTALVGENRRERLERVVRRLDVQVRRAGPTLQLTLAVRPGGAPSELPLELGVSALDAQGRHSGPPDAFARMEVVGESVLCSVPARGLRAGDPVALRFSVGEAHAVLDATVS